MKMKTSTLLLLFLSTTLFAQKGWNTLSKDSYAISYPNNWVTGDQMPLPSTQFVLLADENSNKKDQFRENINLNIEDIGTQTLTIDQYATKTINKITNQIPSAKILSNEAIKIDYCNAKSVVWSANYGNGMNLKFKQIIFLIGKKAYTLTYSSTVAEYDKYLKMGDKILYSFILAD